MANDTKLHIGRRDFLKFGAASAVAVSPQPATAAPQTSPLLERVIGFISHGPFYQLDNLEELGRLKPILASPPDHRGNVRQVISDFRDLKEITYACGEMRNGLLFSGVTLADLISPEWDALETKWLPIIVKASKAQIKANAEGCFDARTTAVQALRASGFADTTLITDAADIIEPRCIAAAQTMIRKAYRHDAVRFVHEFHECPANMGLQLHQSIIREKECEDLSPWIPADIMNHIEAMFPFSGWGKGRKKRAEPTGLNNRLFSLGSNTKGQQLFHIALSLTEAKKALGLLLGEAANQVLSLRSAKRGGTILMLDAQTGIDEKLALLLPARPQPDQRIANNVKAVPAL